VIIIKKLVISSTIILLSILLIQSNASAYFHDNWDTYGGNYQRTNYQNDTLFAPILNNQLWSANVTGNYDSYGSVCVHDGIVYAVGKDYDGTDTTYWGRDNITALYLENGTIIWEYEVGDDVGFDDTPTYYNGCIYVPTDGRLNRDDAQILCLYANNGTVKWNTSFLYDFSTGTGSCIIDEENNLVIVESVGSLWGLYLNNGTIKYNVTLGGQSETSLAYYNGRVYCGRNSQNSLSCHYSINGTLIWRTCTQVMWDSSPTVVPELNAVYVVQNKGSEADTREVTAVNMTDGSIYWNWSMVFQGSDTATPVYYNNRLYCGLAGFLYCLNASTSTMDNETREIWNISKFDGSEYCSPVYSAGYLYYLSAGKEITCVNATDGSIEYQTALGSSGPFCGDAVLADGILLVTRDDGFLYAWGNTTQLDGVNFPPEMSDENPVNYSVDQSANFTWSITITDPDGDTFDWWINCSDGNFSNGTGTDGIKSLILTNLSYDSNYTVWVNVTDGLLWTREWFNFSTSNSYAITICINYTYIPRKAEMNELSESLFQLVGVFLIISSILAIIVAVTKYYI